MPVTTPKTGFLEESPGVKSMTRLTIAWLMVLATAIIGTVCYYVLTGKPESAVLLAMGGILLTLVVKGIIAIRSRNPEEVSKEG